MNSAPLTLYTFSLSHFSEKIRFALDAASIAYTEQRLTPFFHVPVTRKLGGTRHTTVPVLKAGEEEVQDSTRILEWLAANRAPFKLMPQDPALRQQAMALEAEFDTVGAQIIRFAYARMLHDRDAVVEVWTPDSTPGQRRFLRFAFPVLRLLMRKRFRIDEAGEAQAARVIEAGLERIASLVSPTQRYLVGDTLTVADVTAASLLAPLVCPDQHPIYSRARYRAGMAPQAARWQAHPAFAWVREIYAKHR